ncbi:MAG: hypothetical protein AAF554_04470 [Bacteroidota bacterium]
MDNLEEYIQKNRKAFDDQSLDKDKLWSSISQELQPEEKVIPLWRKPLVRVAASVTVLLALSLTAALWFFQPRLDTEAGFASQELMEIDMHYQQLVSHQVNLIQQHPRLTASDKEEFLSFMDELDAEYDLLKKEMQNNLDNERVLEAIVDNYKKRIELIENLLRQINASKNETHDEGYLL